MGSNLLVENQTLALKRPTCGRVQMRVRVRGWGIDGEGLRVRVRRVVRVRRGEQTVRRGEEKGACAQVLGQV